MGNRGNIIFVDKEEISPCVSVHWNGGPESVYAFLAELEARGVRRDTSYAPARLCQLIGEFFDGVGTGEVSRSGLSLGIVSGPRTITPERLEKLATDDSDNGFYVVSWPTVRRFTITGDDWATRRLREWTADEVARERRTAEGRQQYRDILAYFAATRGSTRETATA